MEQAATFATSFAKLVYLIAHEPDAEAEQMAALSRAVAALEDGDGSLSTSRLNVVLLDVGQTDDGVRLHELVMRMSAHSAHQIDFANDTPAEELLGIARILASEAQPNDDGAAFDAKLVQLNPASAAVHLGRSGFVRSGSATPTSTLDMAGTSPRVSTPFDGTPAFVRGTPPRPFARQPTPPAPENAAVRATPAHGTSPTPPAGIGFGSRHPPARASGPSPAPTPLIRDESSRMIERAIKTTNLEASSDEELIAQLQQDVSAPGAGRLLDELVSLAEQRAQEQRWEVVGRIFHVIVSGEAALGQGSNIRRQYTLAIRRLTKASYVRTLAGMLPRRPDLRDGLTEVLVRLGADGAEALIDLLTSANVLTDRRAYLAALSKCRDAAPTLVHLLGDHRWFVVRNAADLLGEMRATEGEPALLEAASHREERVRRSVATALARLGTPRAIQAVQQLLSDPVPEVRVHAAQGLGTTKWSRVVSVLARALDTEHDAEVQAVILAALGRQATEEAVARLVKAAEPDGRLFKRKPISLRVSAVQALAEANTPAAQDALRRLVEDKERDVRDAAVRALSRSKGEPA